MKVVKKHKLVTKNIDIKNGGFIMNNELKHYGLLGMKWGVRKYQNKDGSAVIERRIV